MNEIVAELSKPVWWVSVVVAGILINLLSSYIKTGVDSWSSRLVGGWNQRSAKKKVEWLKLVDGIRVSEVEYLRVVASESRLRLQSIHMLLLAIFISNFPFFASLETGGGVRWFNFLSYFLAAGLFFSSFLAFSQAARLAVALRKAGR